MASVEHVSKTQNGDKIDKEIAVSPDQTSKHCLITGPTTLDGKYHENIRDLALRILTNGYVFVDFELKNLKNYRVFGGAKTKTKKLNKQYIHALFCNICTV